MILQIYASISLNDTVAGLYNTEINLVLALTGVLFAFSALVFLPHSVKHVLCHVINFLCILVSPLPTEDCVEKCCPDLSGLLYPFFC